jgi:tRNA pseudouridine38-40 synthase
VGVLVEVGRGSLPEKDIAGLLRAPAGGPKKGERGVAQYTAPPSGLFLENVMYEGETNRRPLVPAFPVGRP